MTLYVGTPTTLVGGDTTTLSTKFNDHRDALKALSEPQTSYTPTYAGITAIGNAVVSSEYHRVDKWVEGEVKIVMGSTTTFGAATIVIGLPVATHANYAANHVIGEAFFLDNSVGSASRTVGGVVTVTSTTVFFCPGTGTVTNLVPWTWATSDTLSFNFRYPAA